MILGWNNLTGPRPLTRPGAYEDLVLGTVVRYVVGVNQSCTVHLNIDMWSPQIHDAQVLPNVTYSEDHGNTVEYTYQITWEHYKTSSFPTPLLVYCTVLFVLLVWFFRLMMRYSLDIQPTRPRRLTFLANVVGMGCHAWIVLSLLVIDTLFTSDFDRQSAEHVWTVYACTASFAGYMCAKVKCYHTTKAHVPLCSCEDMLSLWFLPGALFLLWQNEQIPTQERLFSTALWLGIGIPSFLIAQRLGHTLHGRSNDRLYTIAQAPHRCLLVLSLAPCLIFFYQWPFIVSLWYDNAAALKGELLGVLLVLVFSVLACSWINVYLGYRNMRLNWARRSVTCSGSIMLYIWVYTLYSYHQYGWWVFIPSNEYLAFVTATCLMGSLMFGCLGWVTSSWFVERWHRIDKTE